MTSSSGGASADPKTAPFPVEDIVQHPLPGYVAPVSVSFSPDDKLISFLYSPTGTLSRKLFAYDPQTRQRKVLVSPPGTGVDEGNISTEEKLRRERLRERGLGITRYEWAKGGPVPRILVPLPGGVSDGLSRVYLLETPCIKVGFAELGFLLQKNSRLFR